MNGSGFRGAAPVGSSAGHNMPPNSTDMNSILRHHPSVAQYFPRLESLTSSLYRAGELSPAALAASQLLPPHHLSALQAAAAAAANMPQPGTPHGIPQSPLLSQFHPATALAAAAAAANHHSMSAVSSHHPALSQFLYSRQSSPPYHGQPGSATGPGGFPMPPSQAQSTSVMSGHPRLPTFSSHAESPFISAGNMGSRFRRVLSSTASPTGPSLPLAPSTVQYGRFANPDSSLSITNDRSESDSGGNTVPVSTSMSRTNLTQIKTRTVEAPQNNIQESDSNSRRKSEMKNDRRLSIPANVDTTKSTVLAASNDTKQEKIANSLPTQPYYPSHFMKGTVIQLANGDLKRVEELNTEDFVKSAHLTNELKIDASQVVDIDEKSNDAVLLTFAVGMNKVQVGVEATVEHPFFVIGQGWSSCNPERSQNLYGLLCQRLQIGDVCISLTHRELADHVTSVSSPLASSISAPNMVKSVDPRPQSSNISKDDHKQAHLVSRGSLDDDDTKLPRKKRKRIPVSPVRRSSSPQFLSPAWAVGQLAERSAVTPPAALGGNGGIRDRTKRRRWSVA